jgi:hypothetical protein
MLEEEIAATDTSHQLDLLPKFRPEFNPIENVWGLRKVTIEIIVITLSKVCG